MEKIKVYCLKIHGQKCSFDVFDALIESIRIEVENMEENEPLNSIIEVLEMTQKEYDDLPEFVGY